MDYDFLGNFERFELMAFFSGYAILYALLNGILPGDRIFRISKARILSYSYPLTATLFLGYTARKLFTGPAADIQAHFHHPFLYWFGILAILFWIPVLNSRNFLCLLHSLVYFAMIPLDIISFARGMVERAQVSNDMNILTLSILFNVSTAILVTVFLFLSGKLRKHPADMDVS